MTRHKQAWLLLTLVLLASAFDLPARIAYIRSILPIVRLWFDPDEQNRIQYPDVPHDLLRAADHAIPRDAGVLLVTPGTDVRHAEYVTYHRALYLLAPRSVWWLTPASSDGTWESRWWLSRPITRDSVLEVAAEKGASFVLAYSVPDLMPAGPKLIDMKEGYVVQLSESPAIPVNDVARSAYASTLWPLQISLAVSLILILGSIALSLSARLGYQATGVEAAALAWSLGAGLTSIGMLWLNALGFGLRGQITMLSVLAAGAFLASANKWRTAFKRRRCDSSDSRFGVLKVFLSLFILTQVGLATIMAVGGPLHFWDSWVNWAMKARTIYLEGHISAAAYLDSSRAVTLLDYPLMVPLVQAWIFGWIGAPDDRFVGVLSVIFYLALAGISYAAVRRWGASSAFAMLAAASMISIPHIAGQAGGVFAEVPLAAYTIIAAVYLIEWQDHGSKGALLISALAAGMMPWTKREGLVLLTVLCASSLITSKGTRRAWIGTAACVCSAVIIAGPWYAFLKLKGVADPAFVSVNLSSLLDNAARLGFIATSELKSLASPYWGFVWPLVLLFGILSWRSRSSVTHIFSITPVLYLALIALAYVFSSYVPYQQHVISSIDRVITPLAAFPVLWIAGKAASSNGQRSTQYSENRLPAL